MAIFKGQFWLVPDRVNELSVEIFVDEERIKLVSNGTVIGDWSMGEIDMELRDNDIHIFVEGEEVVVWSSDPGFAPALVGEEIVESDEPYVPYEPPSINEARLRALKRRRRAKRWFS